MDLQLLSEFKPMGLKLHKSPSFLELIEKELNEVNKNDGFLPSENLQVGNKKDVKTKVGTSDSIDKLKASNFPALRLKIGNWEVMYSNIILVLRIKVMFLFFDHSKILENMKVRLSLLTCSFSVIYVQGNIDKVVLHIK